MKILLRGFYLVLAACLGLTVAAQPAIASSGPPLGRYACYDYGYNFRAFYNGVTVVIEPGSHYTTQGANFTGRYRYAGGRIEFLSGKLAGLRSWYTASAHGHAIHIAFRNGNTTNTAVCGRLH